MCVCVCVCVCAHTLCVCAHALLLTCKSGVEFDHLSGGWGRKERLLLAQL